MAAYETQVTFDRFSGIDQSMGEHNVSASVASDARNVDTAQGQLAPAPGYRSDYPALPAKIVTLAGFYRRNHPVEAERRVLVAATASALYAWVAGNQVWAQVGSGYQSGDWSYVTYEATRGSGASAYVTDVLILSNPLDGMVAVYGDTMGAESKPSVPKFSLLARHAERIWGAGVPGEPDNLYYSRPFDPFDWTLKTHTDEAGVVSELPEESGGTIQLPTWDGDRFIAICRFGNYLLACKQNSVFYVRGMSAGAFAAYEAYGTDGAFARAGMAVDATGAYYLSDMGLGRYDGNSARLLDVERLKSVFHRLGGCYPQTACTAIRRHVIYMALPVRSETTRVVNGLTVTEWTEPEDNNLLVEYDIRRGAYMIRSGISAYALINHGGQLLFASGSDPCRVYELTGDTYGGAPVPVRWVSAWQDLGAKNVVKSGFTLYFTGASAGAEQQLTLSIETEKAKKSRLLTLGSAMKKQRVRIGNRGRRFRLIIEADSNAPWSIEGGIQVNMDVDAD